MVTVTLCLLAGATLVADEAARELGTLFQEALKNASHVDGAHGLKHEWVAACLRVPRPKLSDQLHGKAPFTYMHRFFLSRELREETDFWPELLDLLDVRFSRVVLRSADLSALIDGVRRLVGTDSVATSRKVGAA